MTFLFTAYDRRVQHSSPKLIGISPAGRLILFQYPRRPNPTAHNQLRFVMDRNCIHATLDDRWLDTMPPLNAGIPYLRLRDAIAPSTIELASLVS